VWIVGGGGLPGHRARPEQKTKGESFSKAHYRTPPPAWIELVVSFYKEKHKARLNSVVIAARWRGEASISTVSPLFKEHVELIQSGLARIQFSDFARIADFATSLCSGASPDEVQEVLDEQELRKRLELVLIPLRKELETAEIHMKIRSELENKMSNQQREYMLRAQLKVIKNELGMEKDDRDVLVDKYHKRLAALKEAGGQVNDEVNKVIEDEINKLGTLYKSQSEFNITKSYLDWLTAVPWGYRVPEEFEVKKVQETLDKDHFGMDKVKKRIKVLDSRSSSLYRSSEVKLQHPKEVEVRSCCLWVLLEWGRLQWPDP
jgi:ATP-dependent Lon protease